MGTRGASADAGILAALIGAALVATPALAGAGAVASEADSTAVGEVAGQPSRLRYLAQVGSLWVTAPCLPPTPDAEEWGIWRIELAALRPQRIARADSGLFDVTVLDGNELAAWVDEQGLRVWRSRGGRASTPREPVATGTASPIRWAADRPALAWLDLLDNDGGAALCLWRVGESAIERVPLPQGAQPVREAPVVWGASGTVVRIICRTAPMASYLLTWSPAAHQWYAWSRRLPEHPTAADFLPPEGLQTMAWGGYEEAPGLPVILSWHEPFHGWEFGLYYIVLPDEMRCVGEPDPALRGVGVAFIAPSAACKVLSAQLDRAVFVWPSRDASCALWQTLPRGEFGSDSTLPLPADVPIRQQVAFGPEGRVLLLAGQPGAWRVLSVDSGRREVTKLVELP